LIKDIKLFLEDDYLIKCLYNLFIHSKLSLSQFNNDNIQMTIHSNASDLLFSPSPSDLNNDDRERHISQNYNDIASKYYPLEDDNYFFIKNTTNFSFSPLHPLEYNSDMLPPLETNNEPEELIIDCHNYNIIYPLPTHQKKKQNNKNNLSNNFVNFLKLNKKNFNKSDIFYYPSLIQQLCSCYCSSVTFFNTIINVLNQILKNYLSTNNIESKLSNKLNTNNIKNKNGKLFIHIIIK